MGSFAIVEACQGIDAPRAADGESVVFLGIEIEHGFAREQTRLQSQRSAHALFLIQSKERLNRRMCEFFGGQHGEDRGDAEAIVRA